MDTYQHWTENDHRLEKESMRAKIRRLEQDNKQQSDVIAAYQKNQNEAAENAAYMILRLEALRDKFQLSVDAVNVIAEAFLDRQYSDPEMMARAQANVREFTINGQPQPLPSNTPALQPSVIPGLREEPPAHCASDDGCIAFPGKDSQPPAGKPAAPVRDYGE